MDAPRPPICQVVDVKPIPTSTDSIVKVTESSRGRSGPAVTWPTWLRSAHLSGRPRSRRKNGQGPTKSKQVRRTGSSAGTTEAGPRTNRTRRGSTNTPSTNVLSRARRSIRAPRSVRRARPATRTTSAPRGADVTRGAATASRRATAHITASNRPYLTPASTGSPSALAAPEGQRLLRHHRPGREGPAARPSHPRQLSPTRSASIHQPSTASASGCRRCLSVEDRRRARNRLPLPPMSIGTPHRPTY